MWRDVCWQVGGESGLVMATNLVVVCCDLCQFSNKFSKLLDRAPTHTKSFVLFETTLSLTTRDLGKVKCS